jgi:hypothetical protein
MALAQATAQVLARDALAELEAAEPDRSPVQLLGGRVAYGLEPVSRVEAARDPANAPAMRPHVVAPCQELASYPALRLHCTCKRGLDFLALAPFSTGVLVVSSPRRLPKKRRGGGTQDLASPDDDHPDGPWTFSVWEASMLRRTASHSTGWMSESHPALGNVMVMGDTAKRQVFYCKGCGATHVFLNVTLLRLVLQAIAEGSESVPLAGATGSEHVERPDSARAITASRADPLPVAAQRHVCTIWCLGGEHVELAGPLEKRSDDEIRTGFANYGLEVTLIEPTPEHMNLPGQEPGRLVWFRTWKEARTEII